MSLYFLCCSVNTSVCLVCCVFVIRLVKQVAICLRVVAGLLLLWMCLVWVKVLC